MRMPSSKGKLSVGVSGKESFYDWMYLICGATGAISLACVFLAPLFDPEGVLATIVTVLFAINGLTSAICLVIAGLHQIAITSHHSIGGVILRLLTIFLVIPLILIGIAMLLAYTDIIYAPGLRPGQQLKE